MCNLGTVESEAKEMDNFVVNDGILVKYTGTETEIEIPDYVNAIGKKAFYNNQIITSVIIPKNVKKIENAAFYNCKRLQEVKLEQGVEVIGEEAFYHCIGVQKIEFPKTIKNIKDSAFEKCKRLSKITFPDKNILFGECVFSGIKRGNGGEFGEYVIANKNTLIQYIESAVQEEIIIPDFVRAIQTEAFSLSGEVYKITIPGTVSTIQEGIFGTTEVQEIIIKDGTKELEDSAFEDCDNLEQITVPSSVSVIGKNLFPKENKDIVTIRCEKKSPIYYYGKKNGYNVEVIENSNLPVTMKAKQGVVNQNVGKEEQFQIKNGILLKYDGTKQAITIPEGVKAIGNRAFAGNHYLEKVTLPDTIEKLGDGVFEGCINLEEVRMSVGLKSMGISCFKDCTNLSSISSWPSQISRIPDNTFMGSGLKQFDFSGIEQIGKMAFASCNYLKYISGGEQVKFIGQMAFYGTEWLEKDQQNIFLGHVYVKNNGQEATVTIPEGVTMIYENAFRNNQNLREVRLPSSVYLIGDSAFFNCKRLKTVEVKEGLKSIGEEAFRHCISLESILFPDSIEKIQSYAFAECRSLSEYQFPENDIEFGENVFYGVEQGNAGEFNEFIVANHNTLIAYVDSANEEEIRIPKGVEKIGLNVFQTYHIIGTLYIPGTVKTIQIGSFEYPEISNIILENGVKEIGNLAFYHCTTDKITIPNSVEKIESLLVWKKNIRDVVIACEKNSFAYEYAKRNNITIQLQFY